MYYSKRHFQPQGKTALVVGASQGIGADIALRLYQQNCSVVLVARTEKRLQEQVANIKASAKMPEKAETTGGKGETPASPPIINYIACDVANYSLCTEMWHTLASMDLDPDFIFCCAGLSIPKLFGELSGQELESGMSVNYLTAVNTVHAGHKHALETHGHVASRFKRRHVVLFSSTVALFPFIGYAQYAPAKAALSALSVVLRQELSPYNYRISCVYPGNFASEGYAEEQKTKPEITKKIEGPSAAIPSLQCCDLVLARLAQGYDSIYTDFIGWVLASSMLGVFPRNWAFFQVVVSFVFLIIAPIANWFIYRDIYNFFEEGEKLKSEKSGEERDELKDDKFKDD